MVNLLTRSIREEHAQYVTTADVVSTARLIARGMRGAPSINGLSIRDARGPWYFFGYVGNFYQRRHEK